jgi:hypothetical protein
VPWYPFDGVATILTENTWEKGFESTEWFRFTATAETQYIHFNSLSFSSMEAKLVDNQNNAVGTNFIFSPTSPMSRTVTPGQTYYLSLTRISGIIYSYQIAFNASDTAPTNGKWPDTVAGTLEDGEWTDGIAPAAGDVIWYRFAVTPSMTYCIWLNDGNDGDGTKGGRVSVRVYSGPVLNLDSRTGLWENGETFMTAFIQNSSLYLEITSIEPGDFSIVVVEDNGNEFVRPVGP